MSAEVVPVCAPRLLRDRTKPLRRVEDLARHVLLHYDDQDRALPQLAWSSWLEAAGHPELRAAGALHFSHLDHSIRAAVDGQGVALAIRPVVQELIDNRRLAVPFPGAAGSDRDYFLLVDPVAAARPDVAAFTAWLAAEVTGSPPRAASARRA
jgi:LysR family glycine cleavage system transcriptional activator